MKSFDFGALITHTHSSLLGRGSLVFEIIRDYNFLIKL
jgi:hypothetical protein